MAVSNDFRDYVLELLEPFGAVKAKRMFGGVGLYADETIFALIMADTMYLKVDDKNRAEFDDEDMAIFNPFNDGKRFIKSYRECPARLLEDPQELCEWARKSWDAGRRSDLAKSFKKKRKS